MNEITELQRLKQRAAKAYYEATNFHGLDCGRRLAEAIRPSIGLARREYSRLLSEIKKLDPSAPDDPFKGYRD